ncbi:MAG: hypothetical protein WBA05_14105 [Gordonia sp. (in: high G+C Gram-positive bacteria)]|uniref:zinc finger domain-containing protein n=1 Tax=Gordonia sp. (in: high G+C Gram-positive bacteria) TaxID=84139 RepID=UPI003C71D722
MNGPLDVGCEVCGAPPGQRCWSKSGFHGTRTVAAEAFRDYDGAPVAVSPMAHPTFAGMWIARFRCPSCGQRHWAVWRDGDEFGDRIAYRPRCRVTRRIRPGVIWLRPVPITT